MTAIVLFLIVHVTLALIVPRMLVAMVTGNPCGRGSAGIRCRTLADRREAVTTIIRTPSPSVFRP